MTAIAIAIARAALDRGILTMHARGWHFTGNRFFSFKTIRTLIDAGEAVRIDNLVVKRKRRTYVRTAPSLSHCSRGHAFTAENSVWYGSDRNYARRRCRACRELREAERAKTRIRSKALVENKSHNCIELTILSGQ